MFVRAAWLVLFLAAMTAARPTGRAWPATCAHAAYRAGPAFLDRSRNALLALATRSGNEE